MSDSPYPGLRPFREDEIDIFFGRESQIDEQLDKLRRSQFLAVVGPSGCGKSSLVRTGVLESLRAGMLDTRDEGPPRARWSVVDFRPGDSPMWNLAHALLVNIRSGRSAPTEKDRPWYEQVARTRALLARGVDGFREVLKEEQFPDDKNLLLLADQFEELFRFRDLKRGDSSDEDARYESEEFVKLLLDVSQQRKLPIYVILTMRTSFLEKCFEFKGLPEAINSSQFLTPVLNEKQLRRAIVGPAKLFGGEISLALLNRLIEDFKPDPDSLPLLQHALMRMWDVAKKRAEDENDGEDPDSGEPVRMTLEDYESIGGLSQALSRHADEALEKQHKDLAPLIETLFRELTSRTGGTTEKDTRRPRRIKDIAAVAGLKGEEWQLLIPIISAFQETTRNFLVTYSEYEKDKQEAEEITEDTIIDISHESLIREWHQLRKWVEAESDNAEKYIALATHARKRREKKGGLLGQAQLNYYGKWWATFKPNSLWAARYPGDFQETKVFLWKSRGWIYLLRGSALSLIILVAGFLVSKTEEERRQTTKPLSDLLSWEDTKREQFDDIVVDSVAQYLWNKNQVEKLTDLFMGYEGVDEAGHPIPDDYGIPVPILENRPERFSGSSPIMVLYNLQGELIPERFIAEWRAQIGDPIYADQYFVVPDPALAYHPGLQSNSLIVCAKLNEQVNTDDAQQNDCPEGQSPVLPPLKLRLEEGKVLVRSDSDSLVADVHQDKFRQFWTDSTPKWETFQLERTGWMVSPKWARPVFRIGNVDFISREEAIVRSIRPHLQERPLDVLIAGSELALMERTRRVSPITAQFASDQFQEPVLAKLLKGLIGNAGKVPDLTYALNVLIDERIAMERHQASEIDEALQEGVSEIEDAQKDSEEQELVLTTQSINELIDRVRRKTEARQYPEKCETGPEQPWCIKVDVLKPRRCDNEPNCTCVSGLSNSCESPITMSLQGDHFEQMVADGMNTKLMPIARAVTRIRLNIFEDFGTTVPDVVFEKASAVQQGVSRSASISPLSSSTDPTKVTTSILEDISNQLSTAYLDHLHHWLTLDEVASLTNGVFAHEGARAFTLQNFSWHELRRLMQEGVSPEFNYPPNLLIEDVFLVLAFGRSGPRKFQNVKQLRRLIRSDVRSRSIDRRRGVYVQQNPTPDSRLCHVQGWQERFIPSSREPLLRHRLQFKEFSEFENQSMRRTIVDCLFNEDLRITLDAITEWRNGSRQDVGTNGESTLEIADITSTRVQLGAQIRELEESEKIISRGTPQSLERLFNRDQLIQLMFGYVILDEPENVDRIMGVIEKQYPDFDLVNFINMRNWMSDVSPNREHLSEPGMVLASWMEADRTRAPSMVVNAPILGSIEHPFHSLAANLIPELNGMDCSEVPVVDQHPSGSDNEDPPDSAGSKAPSQDDPTKSAKLEEARVTARLLVAGSYDENAWSCVFDYWKARDPSKIRLTNNITGFKRLLHNVAIGRAEIKLPEVIDRLNEAKTHSNSIFNRVPRRHLLCIANFYTALQADHPAEKRDFLAAAVEQNDPECLEGRIANELLRDQELEVASK